VPKSPSRSKFRSPDPGWAIEFEQVICELPPPHRPALLYHVRHHHPSTRPFIHSDQTTTRNCLQATRGLLVNR